MAHTETIGVLEGGVEKRAMLINESAAGSKAVDAIIQSDTILATLWVSSVGASLTVTVYGVSDEDHLRKVPLFTFPTISAPTTNLVLKRAAVSTARIFIEAVYTGAADFEVRVRAVNGGISDTKIIGAASLTMSQKNINSGAPQILIPSALTDRAGLLVKNWNSSGNIFIGATAAEATLANGYPLAPKDAVSMDVQAGVTIYAVADVPAVDTRIVEVGG